MASVATLTDSLIACFPVTMAITQYFASRLLGEEFPFGKSQRRQCKYLYNWMRYHESELRILKGRHDSRRCYSTTVWKEFIHDTRVLAELKDVRRKVTGLVRARRRNKRESLAMKEAVFLEDCELMTSQLAGFSIES